MVKTPIQTMSSACQNRLKQRSRRRHHRPEAEGRDLRHHDQRASTRPERHMQSVRADQREEGGQEGAARGPGALARCSRTNSDISRTMKDAPRTEGDRGPEIGRRAGAPCAASSAQRPQVKLEASRQPVSMSTCLRSKSSTPVGPASRLAREHRIGGEQRAKDHDVAQQEQPEAEATTIVRRRRARALRAVFRHHADPGASAASTALMRAAPRSATCAVKRGDESRRESRLLSPRARRATSAADTIPAEAHDRHPPDVPDRAQSRERRRRMPSRNPDGAGLPGTSDRLRRCSVRPRSTPCPLCFMLPKGIDALHLRQHREVPGGGGEAVDHSSVRPFHGSPVRSRRTFAGADADDELQRS